MTEKKVLTFQDISCFGQCSITVALPIISACGVETAILPAAILSTHTGEFKGYTFRDLTDDLSGIVNHWLSEGLSFDCLYTGYLGNIEQINFVKTLREKLISTDGVFIVDPAMADFGKLYNGFDSTFVKKMAELCKSADIILPNITEAALMTNSDIMLTGHTEDYILMLLKRFKDMGVKKVILKGIQYIDSQIGVAIYDCANDKLQYYFTEKMEKISHGTGDCYAAAFTGAIMQGKSEIEAASLAANFVVECIKKTVDDESHWYGVKFEKALPMLVNELNH